MDFSDSTYYAARRSSIRGLVALDSAAPLSLQTMAKKKKDSDVASCLGCIGFIVLLGFLANNAILVGQALAWGFVFLLGCAVIAVIGFLITVWSKRSRFRAIQVANIDSMSGIDFERYLQQLLSSHGYNVTMTQASGDLGVDLVASKGGDKIAIQVKRQQTKISRRAVSDAVAGMHHYGCNKAMVITNNYFTLDAVILAASTGCTLVNRDQLCQWISTTSGS